MRGAPLLVAAEISRGQKRIGAKTAQYDRGNTMVGKMLAYSSNSDTVIF